MLYFWNEAMNDLRRKVISYGIEYFPAPPNKPLTDEESLRESLNDYELIEGCYQLGIIAKEAWFFLQQCRDIRNQYTAAHLSDSQVDVLEAQNFIKNCVKYVLTQDPPSPGFSMRDFMERLRNYDIRAMITEIQTAVQDQAPEIREALLNRLFSEYVDVGCPTTLRANIEAIAPAAWDSVDQRAHDGLGQRYVRVRVGPSQDAALLAFSFFKMVGGLSAIPEAYRRPIYESYARDLLTAHFAPNNFYTEVPLAEALLELGHEVPKEAAATYVKAVILSFVGNTYGYCWAADASNRAMISRFNIECVRAVIHLLDSDRDIQSALTSDAPAARFRILVDLLLERPVLPAHQKRLAFFQSATVDEIRRHFGKKLAVTIP